MPKNYVVSKKGITFFQNGESCFVSNKLLKKMEKIYLKSLKK